MKKYQTWIHIGLLTGFYILILLFITKGNFMYASEVDFIRQHSVFPDYFRNLFYETKTIFPDFAPHLGGGQNIFYFAYYGFLNPIILLSYLLPFVPMTTYIIISHMLLVFLSVILFYFFLKKNKILPNIAFFGSFLFLCSTSFIFHSHRHIMFMNYMPFLLLALFGVIRYFDKQKSGVLIMSILLMILTSFYFSIPGILAVCFYGLYYYLKKNDSIQVKDFFITASKFLIRILLGILLSCFFLLPTAYIILHGRSGQSFHFSPTLLFPKVNLNFLMYGTYGVGATAILWVACIYHLLFSKKENRILTLCLFIPTLFPIFNLLLNGGLYENGKCLLPFLPLYLLLVVNFISHLQKKDFKNPVFYIGIFISFLLLKFQSSYSLCFFLDIFLTAFFLFFYSTKQKNYFLLPIYILVFTACLIANKTDTLLTKNEYQNIVSLRNVPYEKEMDQNSMYRFIENDDQAYNINYSKAQNDYRTSLYSSTSNPYYSSSYYNEFNNNDIHRNAFMLNETNNLFFQRFMGVKYVLTDENVAYGYQVKKSWPSINLYETENVLPIGFFSKHLLNEKEYERLPFNEQLEAFGKNILISGESNQPYLNTVSRKINLDFDQITKTNIEIQKEKDHYIINSEKNGHLQMKLNTPIEDHTLIIRFVMNYIPSCREKDTSITINQITNKLTCKTWKYYNENETFDYVLSSNEPIQDLDISFSKGKFDISDIQIFQIPNTYFTVEEDEITPLNRQISNQKDTIVAGSLKTESDGYFLFTIPYDKGFQVYLDGEKQEYELVNQAFIGFPINRGNHKIELKFTSPWKKEGKYITILSILLTGCCFLLERKKKK